MVLDVMVSGEEGIAGGLYTNDLLAKKVLALRPHIAAHACKNDSGPHFGSVIASTSLPHLLEHLIIDGQINDVETPADKTIVGNTKWVDERLGKAQIAVNFNNDEVALRALNSALEILNSLL